MDRPKININRLMKNIHDFSRIGMTEFGLNRQFGSKADLEARNFIVDYWRRLGLEVRVDEAANLWAYDKACKLKPIVIGSHHDSVANGGIYDGALGVWAATEVAETLLENGIIKQFPLRLVSFTAEEPNEFGLSTIGSKAVSGAIGGSEFERIFSSHPDLVKALTDAGGNPDNIACAMIEKGQFSALIELHIEQGKQLARLDLPVAAVGEITGIYREEITFIGQADHAGTTAMSERRDALVCAGEFVAKFHDLLLNFKNSQLVGTVGRLEVTPNSVNIVPHIVRIIAEIRTPDKDILGEFLSSFNRLCTSLEQERQIKIRRQNILNQPRRKLDDSIVQEIVSAGKKLDILCPVLTSYAGHDAANMSLVCPSAMIFVRTPNGRSHCFAECALKEDIEKGTQLLLTSVLRLCERSSEIESDEQNSN